ncbi:MAG: hypothetical protein PHY05_03870 [Methanothrix sp.]|nr:hypothetical protein [Methanothrix sp.]
MTEISENVLKGESTKLSKHNGIIKDYDLFIFSCGWESRCLEIMNYDSLSFIFDNAMIISFMYKDGMGYEEEYMKKLILFAEEKSTNVERIEYYPNRLEIMAEEICQSLFRLYLELKRPLIIGYDITCSPRYIFLYLMAFCFKYNICKEISFFYSEGIYDTNPEKYIHTKGNWSILEIPGLEAKEFEINKKLFVISAGWEGSRYRSLISRYEPDKIGILLPDPGFSEEYTLQSTRECKPLINDYNIQSNSIVKAPAGDAIYAWDMLRSPVLNGKYYHIAYLTFGPKPHALAMGLRGFVNDNISVLYRIPDGYYKIEVKPNGNFWEYDIKNILSI